jgi:cytoskeletal protein RodZ
MYSLFTFFFIDKMPKEQVQHVQTGTSTLTLLLVAIAGGIVAVSLQPLILLLYSQLGITTTPIYYQQSSSGITVEQVPTTTVAPVVTTQKIETTTRSIVKSTTVQSDLTVDEEPIILKDEPLTIKLPESTTVKPVVNEKSKPSKSNNIKNVDKSEEISQPVKLKKAPQQPEIIDVTGRNSQIPDEVKNFKSTRISTFIYISILTKRKRISHLSFFIFTF